MKRILAVMVVAIILILGGCEEMFTFNAFSGFDQPVFPESADAVASIVADNAGDPQGLLDAIGDLTENSDFFEMLDELEATTPGAKAEILAEIFDGLASVYTDTSIPVEERQEAAIMTAEIYLSSNEEAQEVVNTIVAVAFGAIEDPESLGSLEETVTTLLEDAFGSVENLEAALDALSGASGAYEVFGITIDPSQFETLAESTRASASVAVTTMEYGAPEAWNIGAIAQNALVAIAIQTFLDVYFESTGDEITTVEEIITVATDPAYYYIVEEVIDRLLNGTENRYVAFRNILRAAGLADLFGITA